MPRQDDSRQMQLSRVEPQPIIASAQNFSVVQAEKRRRRGQNTSWQEQAWMFYDVVGEFEYVANWVGNLLSRAKLTVTKNGVPVTTGPAHEALQALFGSEGGKSAALRELGIHSTIGGESFIIHHTSKGAFGRHGSWEVVAPQRVTGGAGEPWALDGEALPAKDLLVIRTWNPHPRKPSEATSPARAALPILNEIWRLTQHVEAQVMSRLKSAGILLMPNEMAYRAASQTDAAGQSSQVSADEFVRELYADMMASIEDRGAVSSLVPIVITSEAEHLDKPRLLEFTSQLDEQAMALRSEAIRRLGLALDVPPEVLTGTGDVSHWQAWAVDESSIKAHTEPLLNRLCIDLTDGYLIPSLTGAEGIDQSELWQYAIEADTSDMRLRPNRSREAKELYEAGLISKEAYIREAGFEKSDVMEAPEFLEYLRRKVATQAVDAVASTAMLRELGLDIPDAPQPAAGNGPEYPPSAEAEDTLDRGIPDEKERRDLDKDAERKAQDVALAAAAEQMVFRALERAGNKMKNQLKMSTDVGAPDPSELYLFCQLSSDQAKFALEGSFTHVDRFAHRYGYDSRALAAVLHGYCYNLMTTKTPHSIERLQGALARLKELTHA